MVVRPRSIFMLPGKERTLISPDEPACASRRCCNSCDDVREAYRRRGWAFKNADTIEQCKREGFTQKMQEQKNEGCQVYGVLEVNKVARRSVHVQTSRAAASFPTDVHVELFDLLNLSSDS